MPIDRPSGETITRSAWTRASTASQAGQWPQPVRVSHCRAAAKASATTERPDPAGPVMQPALAHAVPGGRLGEFADDVVLAGEARPDAAEHRRSLMPAPPHAALADPSSGVDGRAHRIGDLVRRSRRRR